MWIVRVVMPDATAWQVGWDCSPCQWDSWRWLSSQCCVHWPPRRSRRTHGCTPPTCGWLSSPSVSKPRSLALRTSPWQISTACEPCPWAVFRPFSCIVHVCLSFDILFTVGTLTFCDRREQNSSALMVERGVLGFPKHNLAPSQNTLVGTTAFQLSTSKVADLNSHNLRQASKSSS